MHSLILFADAGTSMDLALRIPLSVMNFLEFAIWGAWFVILGNYLNTLGFSRKDIGRVYATMPIGAIIAPMFLGTIADRYFEAQHCMAVLHLVGAVFLLVMARVRTPRAFFWAALVYSLAYSPTLTLSYTVVFKNVPESLNFPEIRVLGTIGWIAAGLALRLLIRPGQQVNNRPLLLAAALSLVLGVYSFFLPHTPPATVTGETSFFDIPFFKTFRMFEEPKPAIFLIAALLITVALSFYYSFTALYLEQSARVKPQNVGPLMTIGQWVEIVFMLSLPWFITTLGMKWVLVLGMAAWAVRYGIFAARPPLSLVVVGIALHGICFDFFLTAGAIHTENIAPADVKASAQALYGVLTYGVGMWLGAEASGWLNQYYTRETVDAATGEKVRVTDWGKFWLVPCVGILAMLVVFVIVF
ncbi:MAG TPA: MFS transporter [Gemmataceae bacterium]|nr:MFS transporter [Gemmataceae bacterium]